MGRSPRPQTHLLAIFSLENASDGNKTVTVFLFISGPKFYIKTVPSLSQGVGGIFLPWLNL